MKIQINITDSVKEVIVEESCNLKELATFMQVSFPNHYHEFKIVPKVIRSTVSPIVINPYTSPYWNKPWYATGGAGVTATTNPLSGTYCIDLRMDRTSSNTNTEL